MKFFVDIGQPVDENLVNSLIKDVLIDNYKDTIGQRTADDDERPGKHNYRLPPPDPALKTPPPSPQKNPSCHSILMEPRTPSPSLHKAPSVPLMATPPPSPLKQPSVPSMVMKARTPSPSPEREPCPSKEEIEPCDEPQRESSPQRVVRDLEMTFYVYKTKSISYISCMLIDIFQFYIIFFSVVMTVIYCIVYKKWLHLVRFHRIICLMCTIIILV